MSWFVVNTHPHKEPMAERHLREQGYRTFLPSFLRSRRHARKVEMIRKALFPGYLFVELDIGESRISPINSTIGVRRLVFQGEQPARAPESLMRELMANADADGLIDDPKMRQGQTVRILRGPFANVVGTLLGLADRDRVMVLVNLLGRELEVPTRRADAAPAA